MTFAEFLVENDNDHLHKHIDVTRQQKYLRHQIKMLLDKLYKFEKNNDISITTHKIDGVYEDDILSFNFLGADKKQIFVRYVIILTDNSNIIKHVKHIVDRINQIFDLQRSQF